MKLKGKIIARSSNSNTFGLRKHIMVFENGVAFSALRSGYFSDSQSYESQAEFVLNLAVVDAPEIASILRFRGFECVDELPLVPCEAVEELFAV